MKSFEIESIKDFMNELIVNERYDSFHMYELRLKTALDYYISGKMNKEFFDEAPADTYMSWGQIKHTVYELIRGERLPVAMKLILMFHPDNVTRLIEMNNLPLSGEQVSGLFLNVYYENERLTVTTGTSLNIFTMDKTLEHLWDETVEKYYT